MQARTCEVCVKRAARYVCQECGRGVCEVCFETRSWVCSDCYSRLKIEAPVPAVEAFPWPNPLKLFLLGFFIVLVGMIVMMVAAIFFGASAGAIIWILPLPPIMVGAGPHLYPLWLILLAAAIVILGALLFFALKKRT